ncbi:hypothetical protein A3C87_03895 [Candidatus Kaiserbacteria bacterium RIFCSPHIGHO2_02_FULL_49_34]|uniref:CD-NTase-associated protein 12/Pycsar effector protein TIR domain-containing protein n=1 Tax=Candidatus Kaiserbacteria bacterium RIFCSPHIGHO2_02_FULL_49_34 TaxID=1798491 RepID=A0A1F6DJW2_9BACT|nr:MAG: hypothetical protein A3C87_03895 [Candidatus Kaiserbacteria bacterium RIFCSPHIGHO2_02_FULL_49_34]
MNKENNTKTTEEEKQEKECFVIMPFTTNDDYDEKHFDRVYAHVIKPAIEKAGYKAVRADDSLASEDIGISIIQMIFKADLVLCDLSSRNSNVMYELGLCHAYEKKVVLLKDEKTPKTFDVQGIRTIAYSSDLRIDKIKDALESVSSAISETALSKKGVNSIVQAAAISKAVVPKDKEIGEDTQLILSAFEQVARRVDYIEQRQVNTSRISRPQYFKTTADGVKMRDGFTVSVGEKIYNSAFDSIGTLVGTDGIAAVVKYEDGKIRTVPPWSVRAAEFTALPF